MVVGNRSIMPEYPSIPDPSRYRRDITDLRLLLKGTWLVVLLAIFFYNVRLRFHVGHLERIFENMLGDNSKLPKLARWFFSWMHAADGLAAPAVIGILTLAGILSLMLLRNLRWAAAACGTCALLLMAHGLFGRFALELPFLVILNELSRGS
jgi:hypothetical protein